MSITPLRQVLNYFENSRGGKSINAIAREMNISPGQVGNLVDFWVRKGKIRPTPVQECGSCSDLGNCPFVIEMPLSYELIREGDGELPETVQPACDRTR